ncbi:MAG: protein rep [Cyclobacteriaceae bacterium]|nr:protein rep [Cyclobacteriaceae bacterium]
MKSLDTLGQLDINSILSHTGSTSNQVRKKGIKKSIAMSFALELIDVAKLKEREEKFKKLIWNSFHCLSAAKKVGNSFKGTYCKNRFCLNCIPNRMAVNINSYLPIIRLWQEPRIVTLTLRNIDAPHLIGRFDAMKDEFGKILRSANYRYIKGKLPNYCGVRITECSYSLESKLFNPHYHIITDGDELSNFLVEQWCSRFETECLETSQDIREIKKTEDNYIKVLKYTNKIFHIPNFTELDEGKSEYFDALEEILYALTGRRVWQKFGFDLPQSNEKKRDSNWLDDEEGWNIFNEYINDWISPVDGTKLSDQFFNDTKIK